MSEPEDRRDEPEPGSGAEIIPLRAADAGSVVAFDEGRPGGAAYIDTTDLARRRDIIPERLRRGQLAGTVGEWAGKTWYQARYHGLRLPWHAAWLSWLAHRGAWRLTCRLFAWANWAEGWLLESQAVAAGRAGHHEAMRAHAEGKKTRGARWRIVAACAAAAAVLLSGLARYAPWWWWMPLAAAVFPVLVWHGRPEGRPIIKPAILPPAFTVPTPEIIRRGFGSLGIAKIDQKLRDGGDLDWVSDVHRDGDGWGVEVDLPHGVTARDIIKRRPELASGLRRPLTATWPEPVPHEHEGRVYLWIGRHDLSKVRPPAYPLLKAGTCDIFARVPFATIPRGTAITVPLFEANWIIGAAPGNGKTGTVRVLGCDAALDVICDLWTHEFSGKGDLEPLAQVSHRYCSGLDDEAIAYGAKSAALLRRELETRQEIFKKIPRERRPDGKLTRELAEADRRLRPVLAIFDEVQNAYMHPEHGAQFAADMAHVGRLGRAYGIMLVQATQRPDRNSLPTSIRGIVTARFCLKVPDQDGNDMILGTGAYKAGFSAVAFRHEIDAGLGWLRGTADPQAVKTYYLDLNATAKVCARARAMRQAAGVLSGYALGEDGGGPARDVLADVLSVFRPGETGLHWQAAAERLAERLPGRWAEVSGDALSAQCRELGVPSAVVKMGGTALRGCRRADVEAAAVAS
jgi:DNA segregation ATPase FtsK/SpoIIIE, S-DNA-T family